MLIANIAIKQVITDLKDHINILHMHLKNLLVHTHIHLTQLRKMMDMDKLLLINLLICMLQKAMKDHKHIQLIHINQEIINKRALIIMIHTK